MRTHMSSLTLSCLHCLTASPSRCLLLPAAGALSLLYFLGIFLLPSKQESLCIKDLGGSVWIGGSFQFQLLVIYSSIYIYYCIIYLRHVPFYFYACILPHFATFACVPRRFQGRVLRRLLVHLCLATNPLEAINKWNARLTKRAAQYQLYHIDDIESYCISAISRQYLGNI